VDRDNEKEAGESIMAVANQSYRYLSIQQQRERLPIFKSRKELLYLVEKYQTVIVVGQTGCGKTTRRWLSQSHIITHSDINELIT
jgi:ATP-dependent RNA helicase DDX35